MESHLEAPPPEDQQAGWRTDPLQDENERYWDGARWTERVRAGGYRPPQPSEPPEGPRPKGLAGVLGAFRRLPRWAQRNSIIAAVLVTIVLLTQLDLDLRSSGSDEPGPGALQAQGNRANEPPVPKGGGFKGLRADHFELGRMLCGSQTRAVAAAEYGLPPSTPAIVIARAYARDAPPALRAASREGCLTGLRER